MEYPEKYNTMIDAETWAFINGTEAYYPPDAVDLGIADQRAIYDKMCRAFFAGYPGGIIAHDAKIEQEGHTIPTRRYELEGANPVAEIVYYHGGGFVVGGLESHDDVCAELCARTGFAVTSIDFRLAPEHTFPADFDDAVAGFRHVARNTKLPIIVVGDSAGGNLAAAVSHHMRGEARQPAGQVLIYPGLGSDLTQGSFVEHAEAPMLTTKDTTFYKTIRTAGDDTVLKDKRCTPLNDTDFSNLPPTVVVAAQCDPLCDNGKEYCDAVSAAGGQAISYVEEGLVHGYLRGRHTVARIRESFDRIVSAVDELGRGQVPLSEQDRR